jgi:hypothetical protein
MFYSYSFLTSSVEKNKNENRECVTIEKWHDLVNILSLIDSIQTLIFPFILISIINISILLKLINNLKPIQIERKDERVIPLRNIFVKTKSFNSINQDVTSSSRKLTNNSKANFILHRHHRKSKNKKTLVLLIIVTIFLVINSPLAIKKIFQYFEHMMGKFNLESIIIDEFQISNSTSAEIHYRNESFLNNPQDIIKNSENIEIGFKLASLLYYINFSINFLLYPFKKTKSNLIINRV